MPMTKPPAGITILNSPAFIALPFVLQGITENWTAGKWREELLTRYGIVESEPGVWEVSSEPCGAFDGLYGVCNLPMGHEQRMHQEWRNGKLYAEWSGCTECDSRVKHDKVHR